MLIVAMTTWGAQTRLAERLGVSRQRIHQILYDTEYNECPKCEGRKRKAAKLCRPCRDAARHDGKPKEVKA